MDIFKIMFGGLLPELVKQVSSMFSSSLQMALNIETLIPAVDFQKVYLYIAGFAFGLLTFNILKKMFGIYVAKIEGDSGTSPLEYLKSYAKAVIVIYSFNFLYTYFTKITVSLYDGISNIIVISNNITLLDTLVSNTSGATYIMLFIYVVCLLVLQVMLFMNGITILILKLGIPLACTTIADGSNNKFTATMSIIGKLILTTFAQLVVFNLSLITLSSSVVFVGLFISIGLMAGAFKMEKQFTELFAASAGSGVLRSGINVTREIWQTTKLLRGGK